MSSAEGWIALLTLTALEIVLGIDNIVFISILAGKLPAADRNRARKTGLFLAMFIRIALLFSITWVMRLTTPIVTMFSQAISGRDLILIGGGLFLIAKSTHEIHDKLEGEEGHASAKVRAKFASVITQIVLLDIVFSLDSVITAVGMARDLWVMVRAPPFGSTDPLRVFYDQARDQESRTALVILERFVAEANLRIAGVDPAVRIEATGVAGAQETRFFDFLLPGILAMTVMQTGLQGVTWVVTGYRERLILKRVLATPVRPFVFLSGLVARYAVTNIVQLGVIVLIGVAVFHARIVGSLGMLAAVALFGALAFVGIGFAVSTWSKTPESANLLGSVISFPMLFLAGTLWPREFMPAFMQPVISLLPLTPLVEAMRGIATRGDTVMPYLAGLAYLGLWGGVTFALAAWRFKWE